MEEKLDSKKVLVVAVLDETGSMMTIKDRTISCFNEYVKGLIPRGKSCHMSLTKFNSSHTDIVCEDVPVKDVPELTNNNYHPDCSTPLFDAIGISITRTIEKIKKSKENPDVLFVVLTDGEENDSRQYRREQIVDMIKEQEKNGWTFVYLGANQDAWSNASAMGWSASANTATFAPNDSGTFNAFANVSASTNRYFARRDKHYTGMVLRGASLDDINNSSYSDKSFLTNATGEEDLTKAMEEYKKEVLKKEDKKNGKSK